MPGGDRTGPTGMGPRTGRGLGFCAGYEVPGSMNPQFGRRGGYGAGSPGGWGMGFGRGRGRGRGFGRGWGWNYFSPAGFQTPDEPSEQPTLQTLINRLEQLQVELSDVKKRMEEFKSA